MIEGLKSLEICSLSPLEVLENCLNLTLKMWIFLFPDFKVRGHRFPQILAVRLQCVHLGSLC